MDTDQPLLQTLALASVSPGGSAALVLGGLLCVASGIIAYAATAGKLARQLGRAEFSRTLIGMALAVVAGAGLLYFGLHGTLRPVLQGLAAGGGDTQSAQRAFEQLARVLEAGNAIWPAVLLPALGAVLGIAVGTRSERSGLGLRSGQLMAELLTFWLPRRHGGNGTAERREEEPEFEITMASGEQVEAEEREYIENILELGETTALQVMTPRTDVVALDVEWEAARMLEVIAGSRYSRFPIYEGSIDNVVGVLHLREVVEFLARPDRPAALDVRAVMLEPFFVPAGRKVDDVLRDLQRRKGHLAVVLDEFGGTAGILTIEDLLEEIVGEIQDEYDDESKLVHQREDGSYILDAQLQLEDLSELLGLAFEEEDVDTLGGFIANKLGHIPAPQEKVLLPGLRFTVLSVARNRVSRVLVERISQ